MSQLNIHYSKNQFNYEIIENSYQGFKGGPCPGYRAPNAPVNSSSLFILLAQKPINILYFNAKKEQPDNFIEKINVYLEKYKDWLKIHSFILSPVYKILFKRYGVISSAIYVIRPDGYVGFRINSNNHLLLKKYLKIFFE